MHACLRDGDGQVRVCELVRDVPAQRAEATALRGAGGRGIQQGQQQHGTGRLVRTSCTTAWKKQRPKRRRFHAAGCAQSSNHASLIAPKEPMRFARMPLGGSFVILMPRCRRASGDRVADAASITRTHTFTRTPTLPHTWRTDTGKARSGMDVSQRRKSRCARSGEMPSTRRSSCG